MYISGTVDDDNDSNGVIHIKEANENAFLMFYIDVVTPAFLKDVFHLKTLPSYLVAESNGNVVPIDKTKLKKDETYLLNHYYNSGHTSFSSDRTLSSGKYFVLSKIRKDLDNKLPNTDYRLHSKCKWED